MNIQELIDYRPRCLVHSQALKPHFLDGPKLDQDKVSLHQRGISLCSHHRQDIYGKPSLTGLNYRYDGAFDRNDACPKWVVNNTIRVYMICDYCFATPIHKARSIGYTTLMQIRESQYYYTFELVGNETTGTYEGLLEHEVLKFTDGEKFYHVDVYLQTGHASVRTGTCDGSASLDRMLKGMINLSIPSLSKMESLEQITDKIKLYTLFS
jgi:hypothetical protein